MMASSFFFSIAIFAIAAIALTIFGRREFVRIEKESAEKSFAGLGQGLLRLHRERGEGDSMKTAVDEAIRKAWENASQRSASGKAGPVTTASRRPTALETQGAVLVYYGPQKDPMQPLGPEQKWAWAASTGQKPVVGILALHDDGTMAPLQEVNPDLPQTRAIGKFIIDPSEQQ